MRSRSLALPVFPACGLPGGRADLHRGSNSWEWFPQHRWIYDKLAVALSQGLLAAPHGVMPPSFPVFSKPITNLRGMGTGSQVIDSAEEYRTALTAGHFWCTLLTGRHVSTDVALVDGEPRWWRHTTGATAPGGTFDYWLIHAEAMPEIEDWCGAWARQHLRGYTGMANFETIGGRIIEAHLRFADQWPDLYGPGWVEAVVRLHVTGDWSLSRSGPRRRLQRGTVRPARPALPASPAALVERGAGDAGRLQRPDHLPRGQGPEHHAMPPGGFRLAIVNARRWRPAGGARATARGASSRIKRPPPTAPRLVPRGPRPSG